ncbi:MAG: CPBP family intramembrane metalloprotease [Streptosporangiales bacterium]|nr:CPBP family intramembrane metalloprotease [Streptosporangiales bacterium]
MPSRLRHWVAPSRPDEPAVLVEPAERRGNGIELTIVFAMTLGLSGFRSLLSLLEALAKPEKLGEQKTALNVSQAAQSWIDLGFQLAGVVQLAAWGGIAVYLLWRGGLAPRFVGLDRTRPGRDLLGGLLLTACIGIPGLGLYLAAQALDLNLTVQPTTLGDHWWRVPTLILAAAGNAWAEEVLVVGYLATRLRQFGLRENTTLLASAVLRGSYHLYQGFGGFVGNLVMGVIFCRIWQRTNRLWPLVLAHTLLDVVAFVGYALLRDHVGWLPG